MEAFARLGPATDIANIEDEDLKLLTQRRLNTAQAAKQVQGWALAGTPADRARLNAYSAKGAGTLYWVIPCKALDMKLSSSEFVTNVACRLGVDVMEGGEPCPKCGMQMDGQGIHPQSCMAGGDAVLQHNAIRDVHEDYCRRGGLRPEHEAPGLLRGEIASMERPADILVIPNLALAQELPDGSRAVRTEKVCFDFAIVNALGPSHWSQTVARVGGAAEGYDSQKRRHNRTEARCREQGLTFWPLVFEQQGGCSKAADAATRAIANAVANIEGCKAATIRKEIRQRIAVILARSVAAMIARRQPLRVDGARRPPWRQVAKTLVQLEHCEIEQTNMNT